MGKPVFVYSLNCPITKEVRYIGKANNIQKRLASHLRDCKTRKTPVYNWINKLQSKGLTPEVHLLKQCNLENWQSTEIALISEYKENGARLLNVALGGDEPHCTKEQRAKNGKAVALKIHSDPQRKRIWKLRQTLGYTMKFLKENNMIEDYNDVSLKLTKGGFTHSYGFL